MDRKYLIVYDIREPDRLRRVAKIMEDYGQRVQKSVFEAALAPANIKILKTRLLSVIDPDEDGVKFFLICPKCDQRINIIGHGNETDLFQDVVII